VTDPRNARSAGVRVATAAIDRSGTDRPSASAAGPLTREAFDALYRTTVDDVFAYVATLVRDRGVAEDVVAAAFERAFRRLHTYDARRGSHRQWLFGIARHAALDELRRRTRVVALAVEPGAVEPALADDGVDPVRRATVRVALAGLEPRDRELVALKFFAGLDNAEIAGVLRISPSNAGTRLHRAVDRLREACHAPS
jgi:RNA polymerase sigma-70 factor, ECF subfamily